MCFPRLIGAVFSVEISLGRRYKELSLHICRGENRGDGENDEFSIPSSLGALNSYDQATKGIWRMSWHQKTLKGVEDCEKLGGVVKRALIPRSLNRHVLNS